MGGGDVDKKRASCSVMGCRLEVRLWASMEIRTLIKLIIDKHSIFIYHGLTVTVTRFEKKKKEKKKKRKKKKKKKGYPRKFAHCHIK